MRTVRRSWRAWLRRSSDRPPLAASLAVIVFGLHTGRGPGAAPEALLHAGSRLDVRLTTSVSTRTLRGGEPVSAMLVADVPLSATEVLPARALLRGTVRQSTAYTGVEHRAILWLEFQQLVDAQGLAVPIATRVVEVDNARETVDGEGRILGILPPREVPSGAEERLRLASLLPEAFVLETAEYRLGEDERPDIVYDAGVDLTLETLTETADVPAVPPPVAAPPDAALVRLARLQPTRTAAGTPRRPADVINLLLLGTEAQIAEAFARAGWTTADALGLRSDVKTILAVAEDRDYQLGPVSQEWIDGRLPDLVFQRQNNTFARRHHIRIWKRPQTWQQQPVWIAAATHDVGIKFDTAARTFTHRVAAAIDAERQTIVDDLTFAGAIEPPIVVDRPAVPARMENATGDLMQTDGRLAVVRFRAGGAP